MRYNVLKLILLISIAGSTNYPCLAGSTESGNESAVPLQVSGPGVGPQINQDIQASPNLSQAAKHVDVVSKDDGVVIRGTVPTNGDKQKINSIAEQSGAQNVRNELKVEKSGITKNKVTPKARIITPKSSH